MRTQNGSWWDRWGAAGLLSGALCLASPGAGQEPDSIRPIGLNPLVVTAERVQAPLVTSTAAVARVTAQELKALPVRSVAEALARVPGLTFLDVDGTGFDPQLTLRGFYGGGEAEYVVVLLDGQPLNGLESGLFDWDLLPLAAVESIEVVRGGASSLYGDAAVGGVINLVSGRGGRGGSASLGGGELGTVRGSFSLAANAGGGPLSVYGAFRRSDGFREHAKRGAGSAGGSVGLASSERGELVLSTLHHWRQYDEPGPLTAAELADSRTAVHPFYRFDEARERLHRVALDVHRTLETDAQAAGFIAGELRALEAIRTLPLSPDFADTKARELATARLLGSAQLRWADGALPLPGALLLGADWSAGRLDNEHYNVLMGDANEYRAGSGERTSLSAAGQGGRLAAAGFARYELRPTDALRLTIGGRVDWLRDTFDPEPDGLALAEIDKLENTHVAFSPQAGVNLRWLRTAAHEGNVFANVGRSFKAPTMDQLFDQRTIPVPFEPFSVKLSNPALEPARGVSYELGWYHHAILLPGALEAALTGAAYQLDMEDELDIDLQTYRYVNIGRSRHRGLELGLDVAGPRGLGAYTSYTLQDVTFRHGEYRGNALKAIPRHSLAAGVRAGSRAGLAGSVTLHTVRGVHLDDANTIELSGYTRVDARLSCPLGRVRLEAEVINLFDRDYSTTGHPDPSGTGTVYYYPAAGRVLQFGIATDW